MDVRKHIFSSLLTGLFIGGLPCTLIAVFISVESLMTFLDGLHPPELIFNYFLALYAVYILLSLILLQLKKKRICFPLWLLKIHAFTNNVGHTIQGVFLAIAGGLFVSLPPILVVEPELINLATVVLG